MVLRRIAQKRALSNSFRKWSSPAHGLARMPSRIR